MAATTVNHVLHLILFIFCFLLCIRPKLIAGFGVQIQNQVSETVHLHCRDKAGDLKEKDVPFMESETWEFYAPTIWTCDFSCKLPTKTLTQSFQVFKHDDVTTYLFCNVCLWRIRLEGFDVELSDGTFLHVFDWQE